MNMLRKALAVTLLFLTIIGGVGARGNEKQGYPERFMRLDELAKDHMCLLTPVATYVNPSNGQQVALIGAIHVAEQEYYVRLNQLFTDYDVVLFEMIGGEKLRRTEELRRRIDRSKPLWGLSLDEFEEWKLLEEEQKRYDQEEKSIFMKLLGVAYGQLSKSLGIQTQHQGIDYSADNFVHADMTMVEFEREQDKKGENFVGLILKSILSSLIEKPQKRLPNEVGMVIDFLTGNKVSLKNKLMVVLAYAPNYLDDTVILEGRNSKCMEVFDNWRNKDVKKIGIFYGAAHLPGLHTSLLERGYSFDSVYWLPAWSTKEKSDDCGSEED